MNRPQTQPVAWTVKRLCQLGLAAVYFATGASAAAAATDYTCDRVALETFEVDGVLEDWQGFRGRRIGEKKADGGFLVRCAYDQERLFLAIEATDDRVIRKGRGDAKREDWVSAVIKAPGGKAVTVKVFPGTRGYEAVVTGRKKGIEIADSMLEGGFSVEVSIPLASIPKWTRTVPAVSGVFRFGDADGKAASIKSGDFRLQFSDADAVFKSFLKATGLSPSDITVDVLKDVNFGEGAERVVIGGGFVGVLSESYIYMKLPVADASDVISARVVNFSGTGRSQILVQFRQHGNGSRDVVAVWNIDNEGAFERVLAFECRKELDGKILENAWSLERAGSLRAKPAKKQKRGYDLVIEATDAVGFTKANYRESRTVDEDPILLPWQDEDSRIYYFDGDSLLGSEAMDPKQRVKRIKAAKARAK